MRTDSDTRLRNLVGERGGLTLLPALLALLVFWLAGSYLVARYGTSAAVTAQALFGLLGLLLGLLLAYPERPHQLSLAALSLMLLLTLWAMVSFSWAESLEGAWLAASSLLFQLAAAGVAAALLTGAAARRSFPYLILASGLALIVVAIWRFLTAPDISSLFSVGRLMFPTGASATNAGLYLALFWPLVWVAIDQREASPVRGAALGLAFGLGCLAYLTRSPAAAWAIAASTLLAFLVSPARFRLLFYLIVPLFLMIWAYPGLDSYSLGDQSLLGPRQVVFILIVGPVVCMAAGMILALLERWIRVSDRMRVIFGVVVPVLVIGVLIYTQVKAPHLIAEPVSWARAGIEQWAAAAKEAGAYFNASPWTGQGLGQSSAGTSLPLRLAVDLGIPGIALAALSFLTLLAALTWPRISSGWHLLRLTWVGEEQKEGRELRWGADPIRWGTEQHALLAVLLWLVGGTVDGQWLSPVTSLPIIFLCAFALARVDAWVGNAFPRLHEVLTTPQARMAHPAALLAESGDPHSRQAEDREQTQGFTGLRRAYRHLERRRRAEKRLAVRNRRAHLYRPPGPLSFAFRAALVTVCLLLLALSVPVAIREYSLARARGGALEPESAVGLARTAFAVFPFGEETLVAEAQLYLEAAEQAGRSESADRHAALLDNLALAACTFERAADADPKAWEPLRDAALALKELAGALTRSRAAAAPFAPGEAALSLAASPAQISDCALLRAATPEAVLARARFDLLLALSREPQNPLLLALLNEIYDTP